MDHGALTLRRDPALPRPAGLPDDPAQRQRVPPRGHLLRRQCLDPMRTRHELLARSLRASRARLRGPDLRRPRRRRGVLRARRCAVAAVRPAAGWPALRGQHFDLLPRRLRPSGERVRRRPHLLDRRLGRLSHAGGHASGQLGPGARRGRLRHGRRRDLDGRMRRRGRHPLPERGQRGPLPGWSARGRLGLPRGTLLRTRGRRGRLLRHARVVAGRRLPQRGHGGLRGHAPVVPGRRDAHHLPPRSGSRRRALPRLPRTRARRPELRLPEVAREATAAPRANPAGASGAGRSSTTRTWTGGPRTSRSRVHPSASVSMRPRTHRSISSTRPPSD